jgi:hypothetical protein
MAVTSETSEARFFTRTAFTTISTDTEIGIPIRSSRLRQLLSSAMIYP